MMGSVFHGSLLLLAVSSLGGAAAFDLPKESYTRRYSSRLMATKDKFLLLETYQEKTGEAPALPLEGKVNVVEAPPVDNVVPSAMPSTSGTDYLSTLWNQVTASFKSMPNPLDKIPKEPLKDVDAKLPDVEVLKSSVKSVIPPVPDLTESLKSVKVPDVNTIKSSLQSIDVPESLKSVKVPDINTIKSSLQSVDVPESLKSVKVPDINTIKSSLQSVDLTESLKYVKVPNVNTVKSSLQNVDWKNIQLPTPPERPEAPGVVLPDGGRLPSLLDLFEKTGPGEYVSNVGYAPFFQSLVETLRSLFETLRVAEFGAWYLALLCFVAWQVQLAGTEKWFAAKLTEAELKAQQAAEAASLAAEGAALTKTLAAKTKKPTPPAKPTELILSDSQKHAMELEKQAMKKELQMLQQETEVLKKQLKAATVGNDVNGAAEPALAPKATPKKVEPRGPEEDERVLKIIKEKDEANKVAAMAAKPKKAAPKKAAAPKKKKAAKEEAVAVMEKEPMKAVPKKAAASKKKKAAKQEAVAVMEKAPKKAAPKKAAASRKKKTAKEEAVAVMEKEPIVAVVVEALELETAGAKDVFFANATSPATEKPKKKVATKKTAPKKAEPVSSSSDNPWSSLSQSTLKRKTVKELSAYLSERGVEVTNDEGKPLKKAELVDAVASL